MWFMNKIANPLVILILRSPLHGMMSATLLLIAYRGRKSGKEYTLPAQYVRDKQTFYIVPGSAEKKTWWRNLRGGSPVRLRIAGQTLTGRATVLDGADEPAAIAQALELYLGRFPAAAKIYDIHLEKEGMFNQAEIDRASVAMVMVRVELDQ